MKISMALFETKTGNGNIKVILDSEKSIDKIGNFTLVNTFATSTFTKQSDGTYKLNIVPSSSDGNISGFVLDDYDISKYNGVIIELQEPFGNISIGFSDTKTMKENKRITTAYSNYYLGGIYISTKKYATTERYFQFHGHSTTPSTYSLVFKKILLIK